MEIRAFGALATALLLCCAHTPAARSAPLRILYAEPFQAQTLSAPGAQKPGPANLRVPAFGRTFELELEDNSRLLRATSAQTRQRIAGVQLLKGTIKDAPGSWVRLTLSGGRYSGAFWDGSELYGVAPRETLDEALIVPIAAAGTAIYRLSDTQGGLFAGTCAADAGSAAQTASPTEKFRSLIRELRGAADTAFAAATREIEVAMVGDFEFTSQQGAGAVSAMLDRMNVVDGIFSSQVGVATIPTDFITFASNTDPFTSSDPITLLNQLADYRNATPLVRGRGLAHLLTGRRLDDNVIGIAFLSSVCAPRQGAGLSEISFFIDSPLVIAHEIGHNFGAPHDAEAGSACASTPPTFLMAPQLNGNPNFSACSLQQIRARIQVATCIVAASNRDLAVSVPSAQIQAVVAQPFDYVVNVDSVGDFAAANAILSVQVPPGSLEVLSATMPGVACSNEFGNVRCELGDLAPAESRQLTLSVRPQSVGDFQILNAVTSTRDINSANDSRTVAIHVVPERAAQVTVTPLQQTVTSDTPFQITYDVAATGVLALNDMRAEIVSSELTPTAVTVNSGTCTIDAASRSVACQLGTIAPGASRRIRVTWITDVAGDFGGFVRAFEAGDPSTLALESFAVHARAARDINLATPSLSARVAIDQDAAFTLQVESRGLNTVADVHVQLTVDPAVTLTIDGPLASSCSPAAGMIDCALGTMAPQSARTLPFRARAAQEIRTQIEARVVLAAPDDMPFNDLLQFTLDVGVADEIELQASGSQVIYDEQLSTLTASVFVPGVNASENVRVQVTLPTGFVARSGMLGDEACALDSANPHVASCSFPRIEPLGSILLQVEFVAPDTGVQTGTIAVSADRDTDAANNTQTVQFEVQPSVDARLAAAPAPQRTRTDMPIELAFTVSTGKRTVPDVRLLLFWPISFDEFSVTAPGATCGIAEPGQYICDWTSLAGNSSVPVAIRARSSMRTDASISGFVQAAADTNNSNNNASLAFPILVPGDAGVSVTQPAVTATVDTFFSVPGVNIATLGALESGFIELTFDPTQLEFFMLNGSCTSGQQPLRCVLPGMEAPGTHSVNLQFVPRSTGVAPLTIRVGAFNDFNGTNDEQTISVTIVDPPSPPPPPSSGARGAGGGGGSMSWLLAALLLVMWHHRRAHRRVHR
jgi:hypothetical protein